MPQFTTADGHRLHYDDRGHPDGAPLILLGGPPGRHPDYLAPLDALTRNRRIIVPHDRGVGGSAALAPQSFPAAAADLESLREHLGASTLDLLAHSSGARAALVWAAAHPERVGRLVLISPGAAWLGIAPADGVALRAAAPGEVDYPDIDAAMVAMTRLQDPAARLALHERIRRAAWAHPGRDSQRWDAALHWSPAPLAAFLPAEPVDAAGIRAGLGRITAPTLLLVGEQDGLVGTGAVAALADLLPGAELAVIEDCGHFPWIEAPAETAMALRAALTDPPPEPPVGRRRRRPGA